MHRDPRFCTGKIEEYQFAVIRDGEADRGIRGAAYQIRLVVLDEVARILIRHAHLHRCGGFHRQRIFPYRQIRSTAEIAFCAKGICACDIQRRNQIDHTNHDDAGDDANHHLALVAQHRGDFFAHINFQNTGKRTAHHQHKQRQRGTRNGVAKPLDRDAACDQCHHSSLHQQQEHIHPAFLGAKRQHQQAGDNKNAERTHRKGQQIGNRVDHQKDGAKHLLSTCSGGKNQPQRQQARDRHQTRIGVRIAKNGVQSGIKSRTGIAIPRSNQLHERPERRH